MTNVLICGYGSIGQKHAQNVKALGTDIKIWRSRADQSQAILDDGFAFEESLEDGIAWSDAVVVATATDQHIAPALKAAAARKAIYLEKPIGHNIEGLDALVDFCQDLVVEVGYQMRQHPNLKVLSEYLKSDEGGSILAFQAWAGQKLDQWRGTDYKKSYSSNSSRGGGALFDLVHEVNLMTWLVGPMQTVYADLQHNSDLSMQAEDLANLILVAENGASGTVQLDMLSPAYRRGLHIVCENAVYQWDMREGKLWRSGTQEDPECIDKVPSAYEPKQMLYDSMAYFLKRIKDSSLPTSCSLREAVHDLNILLAARQAHDRGQKIAL